MHKYLQAEEKFIRSQDCRRNAHADLIVTQDKLRELRQQLDIIPRGNDKYVELVTKVCKIQNKFAIRI